MTFAQWWNRVTTRFSERILIVKRRMTVQWTSPNFLYSKLLQVWNNNYPRTRHVCTIHVAGTVSEVQWWHLQHYSKTYLNKWSHQLVVYIPCYHKTCRFLVHISSSCNKFPNHRYSIDFHNCIFLVPGQIFYWIFQYGVTIRVELKNLWASTG